MWQDAVFTIGGVALVLGLVPMLREQQKPPYSSIRTMVLVLAAYTLAQASLGLVGGAATLGLQTAVWAALGIQKWKQGR